MRSSSVMLLLICGAEAAAFGLETAPAAGVSFLEEFFALIGILPVMYRAARPAPAFCGGNLLATTVVDLGIMVVSSSYSTQVLAFWFFSRSDQSVSLTLIAILVVNRQVEFGSISKTALYDNITLQFKDGDTCTIELNARRFLLRLELEKDRRSHLVGCCMSKAWGFIRRNWCIGINLAVVDMFSFRRPTL